MRHMIPLVILASIVATSSQAQPAGKDLRLTYVSNVDDSAQPYWLYVPSTYDGQRAFPLVIALHGTGGDEAALFERKSYQKGAIREAAEKQEVLLACPRGWGSMEFQGIGENDVLAVMEDVQKSYRVDPDCILLTGHSMGGVGTAYLALHHPDLFAAAAPLASPYSYPWLARNGVRVPFLFVSGALDLEYYNSCVNLGVNRMRKFGAPVIQELIPNEGHMGPVQDFNRIFAWLVKHRRVQHPRSYYFEVDTPLHGRAWCTTVDKIAEPGRMAAIEVEASEDNVVRFDLKNVAEFAFLPNAALFDLAQPIEVQVAGRTLFQDRIDDDSELRFRDGPDHWQARVEKRRDCSLTAFRQHPVAEAPEQIDMVGTEKRLANWITDAMRAATGADVALMNTGGYRGLPIPKGTVDIVDLIQCSLPFNQYLVTVPLSGRDILDILEANLPDVRPTPQLRHFDKPGRGWLIQLSGGRYVFDLRQPKGKKIVESTFEPERIYTVVLEGQVVQREEKTLAGRFKKLDYQTTEVPFSLALYGHAARNGRIVAPREGRVREVER